MTPAPKVKKAKDGTDGVGISSVRITDQGALTVTLTNGTVLNLGNIRGADGIGITACRVTANGELELTYTDGRTENVGRVTGTDGTGIQSVTLSADGELLVTLTDNTVTNLGNIKGAQGEKGEKGDKGDKGDPGRGIAKTELVNGELIVTYTDGTSDNLGKASDGNAEEQDGLAFELLNDGTYGVKIATAFYDRFDIIVPSTYKEKPVTTVLKRGFQMCPRLVTIQLPDSVTVIEDYAFSECDHLESITIPDSLTKIGRYAFYESKKIESIDIPASVKFIGKNAFVGTNLKKATMKDPTGWTVNGDQLFPYSYTYELKYWSKNHNRYFDTTMTKTIEYSEEMAAQALSQAVTYQYKEDESQSLNNRSNTKFWYAEDWKKGE